ncbi:phospholipase A [Campylobacter sp. RM12327]|uniref:phospholipase A n=1 Tax=Campylobacter sputorum TaxID=206 RepID=UPI000B77AB0F|nr:MULTISPECIES: phospholipase A [Campylobacter]ASM39559.1 phospholipase A1 [Campylobacter sputorum]MBE7358812.1 phospholipase A [Campylobacter sp. RM11302]MBF6669802.1 phospholipase A [Campylobacter sp. RM12327]MBF6675004.1 phospholipase A [Campylobacter sp. RM13538]MBF6676562.1 phospholipase A [Campylobacter sp. RM12321]
MKKVILSCICASMLFCENAEELYKKALEFEQNGDFKSAMKYYKISANQSLEFENKLQKDITYKQPVIQTKTSSRKSLSNDTLENTLGIEIYKPNYFVYAYDFSDKNDRKDGEAKFQISFQKPISYDLFGLDETISVAYSQQSFWQVEKDSSPFRESNYEPEMFITIPDNFTNYGFIDWVRFGINHQSNGEDGVESRSWNRAYVSTKLLFGNLSITPRAWYSFNPDKYNDDISSYMGYGDIEFVYDLYGHKLAAMLRNNLNFHDNRGAVELSWYFPLFNDVYGYLQYFNGYGESLIDYNRQVNKVGLGIAILK